MSHGGLTLAKYLRKRDKNIEIIIVEKQEYISYSQCAMPYYISGEVSEEDIVFNSAQDLKDKSANVIAVVRNQELNIEALDNEIKRLKAMKEAREKALNKFKTYIKSAMLTNNIEKIETTIGTIKFTKSTSTEIYDEKLIDKKFIEVVTTEKISKEKIKAALKAGEEVQGARLVENKNLKIG